MRAAWVRHRGVVKERERKPIKHRLQVLTVISGSLWEQASTCSNTQTELLLRYATEPIRLRQSAHVSRRRALLHWDRNQHGTITQPLELNEAFESADGSLDCSCLHLHSFTWHLFKTDAVSQTVLCLSTLKAEMITAKQKINEVNVALWIMWGVFGPMRLDGGRGNPVQPEQTQTVQLTESMLKYFLWKLSYCIFPGCFDGYQIKKQHLLPMQIFCNSIKVFPDTLEQFNAISLIKKTHWPQTFER